jgi:hypothetical protein
MLDSKSDNSATEHFLVYGYKVGKAWILVENRCTARQVKSRELPVPVWQHLFGRCLTRSAPLCCVSAGGSVQQTIQVRVQRTGAPVAAVHQRRASPELDLNMLTGKACPCLQA